MSNDFRVLQKRNRRATWLLLACSFLLLAVVGSIAGFFLTADFVGVAIGIVGAVALTGFGYAMSPSLALRSTGAQPADPVEHRQLHNIVEEVAIAAGIPKPDVYVVNDLAPNAFATGRDPQHASVAATTGLLAKLSRDEIQGVMAHEVAHIRNLDIRVMTVAVATAGAIALIADVFWRLLYFGGITGGRRRSNDNGGAQGAVAIVMIVGFVIVSVLAPLAAGLLRAAVSRSREGLADATAVEITRHPEGLRRALEKLDADVTVVRRTSHATSHLWIEAPDDKQPGHKASKFNSMYNTHPPLRDRINILRGIEGLAEYDGPSRDAAHDFADTAEETAGARAATPEANGASAAGWYRDPSGTNQLRWWDGSSWTSHLH